MKPPRDRTALALFIVLFSWYFLTTTSEAPKGDAFAPFLGAIQIVQGKGILASKVMPGQMFLLVPISLVTQTVIRALHDDGARRVAMILMNALFPAIITAATASILYRVLRRLGHARGIATFAALLFGLATPAAVYAKTFFPQPTEAFFLLACVWGLVAARDAQTAGAQAVGARAASAHTASTPAPSAPPERAPLILSGLAFGALLLVKAVAVAYVPAAVLFVLFMRRDGRGAARLATWAIPALALSLLYLPYNAAARGGALNFGYGVGRDALWGFATPTLVGLHGLLLSPGKGFFYFAPALVLAIPGAARLARRDRAVAFLLGGLALGALLLHAHWWAWHADNAWGPRYLVPIIPLVTLAAAEALRDFRPRANLRTAALAALIALSASLQLLGAAFTNDAYQTLTYDIVLPRYRETDGALGARDDELHLHWIPQFSPLAGHAWLARHALRGDAPDAYLADYPWRALRPDGGWAPRVPDPPPRFDLWLAQLPRKYPTARGALLAIALLAGAGIVAGAFVLAHGLRSPCPELPR